MKKKDYHKTITTNLSAEDALKKICQVNKWWTAHFKGSAKKIGDIFTLQFGENTFEFKVVEFIAGKKMVWLVTGCNMVWLTDKSEWKDTKIVFEISEGKKRTRIEMTHFGLVPEIECYSTCEVGWNKYFGESIPAFLATGNGILFDD